VHAAPDILVIDEVLAVGDTRFRVKCYRRLAAMRDAGAAFVLVSHNPLAILSVCDSATYLSAGRVLAQGPPRSVVARYEEEMAGNGAAIPDGAAAAARAVEGAGARIESVAFREDASHQTDGAYIHLSREDTPTASVVSIRSVRQGYDRRGCLEPGQ
jgi:lipopolysaccharide transport system ATP-binding protein